MRLGLFVVGAVLTVIADSASHADSFQCPEPVRQLERNIKGEAEGKAQTLFKLGDVDFKGQVDASVVNLFEKYPHADRVAILQNFQSTFCNVLKNSNLPDDQKLDKMFQLLRELLKFLPPGETL